jgi:hypothetical protein
MAAAAANPQRLKRNRCPNSTVRRATAAKAEADGRCRECASVNDQEQKPRLNTEIKAMSKPTSEDLFAKERRLRRLAAERGFALVRPWGHERRKVGNLGQGYVLVPHHSGMALDEVEEILKRLKRNHH